MKKFTFLLVSICMMTGFIINPTVDAIQINQEEHTSIVQATNQQQHNESAHMLSENEKQHENYHASAQSDSNHSEDTPHEVHEEEHQIHLDPLLFIILALIIGAATRHLLRKSKFPYTVALLLVGIILGIISKMSYIRLNASLLTDSIEWAGNIDPHLILYIFIPALIFEAAFSLDVHTFKKIALNAAILAIPGLILAMFLTGSLVMGIKNIGIGLENWNWMIALMFGVVISATDPVAVVSLLKELGASKKLSALVEGESLMNDGTAIVIFMYFFLTITGVDTENSAVVEFFRVAVGGVLVGLVIGGLVINWVKYVFNDAMIEISVIIAAAYFSFYVAENLLGVSGILSVVAFGLLMSGVGRTRISPEVDHFLHEFWELFTFIANTLIFIMVGVLISTRIEFTFQDFIILIMIYIGIHIIRALLIGGFFPVMKKAGYGLSNKDAYVLWWGALRGAIGLALALVVEGIGDQYLPQSIQNQFLFLTAGIVILTLFVNATTITWLINYLGLTKISPAKAVMLQNAKKDLQERLKEEISSMKEDKYFKKVDWNIVHEYLPPLESHAPNQDVETIVEIRRRVLQKEKSSYWNQFKMGMLSSTAVRLLSDAINTVLDSGGKEELSKREDLETLWEMPSLFKKLANFPLLGKIAQRIFFDRLTTSSDCARGFIQAQKEGMALVRNLKHSAEDENELKVFEQIEEEINANIIHGQTFLLNLRKNFPEVFMTISTKQAARSILNKEKQSITEFYTNGQITADEMQRLSESVEERMMKVIYLMSISTMPAVYEVLRQVPWLKNRDDDFLTKITEKAQNRVYSIGDIILQKGQPVYSFYIIIRGKVKETRNGEENLPILSAGDTLGESAVLMGRNQESTYSALSPVTIMQIKFIKLQIFMNQSEEFQKDIWKYSGFKIVLNYLADESPFNELSEEKIMRLFNKGDFLIKKEVKSFDFSDSRFGLLMRGTAVNNSTDEKHEALAILRNSTFVIKEGTYLYLLDLNE